MTPEYIDNPAVRDVRSPSDSSLHGVHPLQYIIKFLSAQAYVRNKTSIAKKIFSSSKTVICVSILLRHFTRHCSANQTTPYPCPRRRPQQSPFLYQVSCRWLFTATDLCNKK